MDDHGDTDCSHPVTCVNCDGDHPSFSPTCSKFQFEREVQAVKCNRKVSFPEARRIVQKTKGSTKKSYAKATTNDQSRSSPKSNPRSITTQTDITWPNVSSDYKVLPSFTQNTSSPVHVTISTKTNDDSSEKPTTHVEPPPPKTKIPLRIQRQVITNPSLPLRVAVRSQGEEIPLAPNQLNPHLILSVKFAERGHMRQWNVRMYQSLTNQRLKYCNILPCYLNHALKSFLRKVPP